MAEIKRKYAAILMVLATVLLLLLPGCRSNSAEIVERIVIFKASPDAHPPTGGWALGDQVVPYPENVQRTFSPDDMMYLGLKITDRIDKTVFFTRYAFCNKATGEETPAGPACERGPFEPGQVFLLAFNNPWPVPDLPGIYTVNLYIDDILAASACFEVASCPEVTPPPLSTPPPPRTDWEEGSPPPAGLEGLEKPRSLSGTEKARVAEIAVSSRGADEWLQGRTDYRISAVDWYAVVWNGNEPATWWSLEYDRIENEGVPDFVSPYAAWYPGVTIAVGEGTVTQMQIAVDLDSGNVVISSGPYPSLGSPDRFKDIAGDG